MKLDKKLTQYDVNTIEILSKLATTLNIENYTGTTEHECYFNAFIDFLEEPIHVNFKGAYNAAMRNNHQVGNILFGMSLDLALFEKQFRTEGIKDKKLIDKYNKLSKEYQSLIDLNVIREEEANATL